MNKVLINGATEESIKTYLTVTKEINIVYGKILVKRYKDDASIKLSAVEKWRDQIKSILPDIKDTQLFADKYAAMISKIKKQLKKDATKRQHILALQNSNKLKEKTNQSDNNWITYLVKNCLLLLLAAMVAWLGYDKWK